MKEKYLSIGDKVRAMKEGAQYCEKYPYRDWDKYSTGMLFRCQESDKSYQKYFATGFTDEKIRELIAASEKKYPGTSRYITALRHAKEAYKSAGIIDSKHAQRYLKKFRKSLEKDIEKESQEFEYGRGMQSLYYEGYLSGVYDYIKATSDSEE